MTTDSDTEENIKRAAEDAYSNNKPLPIPKEEFVTRVCEKHREMSQVATPEATAQLVIEAVRTENPSNTSIDNLSAQISHPVTITGELVHISDTREFDNNGSTGRVRNASVSDDTGTVRITLWNDKATGFDTQFSVGDAIEVTGDTKEGYYDDIDVELTVDAVEKVNDSSQRDNETSKQDISTINPSDPPTTVIGSVLATRGPNKFTTSNGSEKQVSNVLIGDRSGHIQVTLWGESASVVPSLDLGETYKFTAVRPKEGPPTEVHSTSKTEIVEETAGSSYTPQLDSLNELEVKGIATIGGVIAANEGIDTIESEKGNKKVQTLLISDYSNTARISVWGDAIVTGAETGDEILIFDAEVNSDGQSKNELSTTWDSFVLHHPGEHIPLSFDDATDQFEGNQEDGSGADKGAHEGTEANVEQQTDNTSSSRRNKESDTSNTPQQNESQASDQQPPSNSGPQEKPPELQGTDYTQANAPPDKQCTMDCTRLATDPTEPTPLCRGHHPEYDITIEEIETNQSDASEQDAPDQGTSDKTRETDATSEQDAKKEAAQFSSEDEQSSTNKGETELSSESPSSDPPQTGLGQKEISGVVYSVTESTITLITDSGGESFNYPQDLSTPSPGTEVTLYIDEENTPRTVTNIKE
jgi:replication factor A1